MMIYNFKCVTLYKVRKGEAVSISNRIIKFLENLSGKFIYPNLFYIPFDHKQLMLSRIRYLFSNNYICDSNDLINNFTEITEQIKKMLNLTIKYNISKDYNCIRRILSEMDFLIDKELISTEMLIDKLK